MSKSERFFQTKYRSPIGNISIASDGENIVGLWLEGQKYFQNTIRGEMILREDLPIFDVAREWLNRYFEGERMKITGLPLAPVGSEFQQKVWKALVNIPYGKTETYAGIAKLAGSPGGCRAAGNAVGANPFLVVVPCHRVIKTDGSIGGFGAGLAAKRALFDVEGIKLCGK